MVEGAGLSAHIVTKRDCVLVEEVAMEEGVPSCLGLHFALD